MADFREEVTVYPAIINLAACLCLEIENSGLPKPCACGPIVGELVYDYCSECNTGDCGGQAWVRFVSAYPSDTFPNPQSTANNCYVPMAYQIEVGIVRCKPIGTNSGVRGYQPPTIEQNVEALRLQLADMEAMRRAIQCCFAADDDRSYIMSAYTTTPPDGDCLGGLFTLTLWSE
jgi:hypothetical protein